MPPVLQGWLQSGIPKHAEHAEAAVTEDFEFPKQVRPPPIPRFLLSSQVCQCLPFEFRKKDLPITATVLG